MKRLVAKRALIVMCVCGLIVGPTSQSDAGLVPWLYNAIFGSVSYMPGKYGVPQQYSASYGTGMVAAQSFGAAQPMGFAPPMPMAAPGVVRQRYVQRGNVIRYRYKQRTARRPLFGGGMPLFGGGGFVGTQGFAGMGTCGAPPVQSFYGPSCGMPTQTFYGPSMQGTCGAPMQTFYGPSMQGTCGAPMQTFYGPTATGTEFYGPTQIDAFSPPSCANSTGTPGEMYNGLPPVPGYEAPGTFENEERFVPPMIRDGQPADGGAAGRDVPPAGDFDADDPPRPRSGVDPDRTRPDDDDAPFFNTNPSRGGSPIEHETFRPTEDPEAQRKPAPTPRSIDEVDGPVGDKAIENATVKARERASRSRLAYRTDFAADPPTVPALNVDHKLTWRSSINHARRGMQANTGSSSIVRQQVDPDTDSVPTAADTQVVSK
jgi:hypothetical protein